MALGLCEHAVRVAVGRVDVEVQILLVDVRQDADAAVGVLRRVEFAEKVFDASGLHAVEVVALLDDAVELFERLLGAVVAHGASGE